MPLNPSPSNAPLALPLSCHFPFSHFHFLLSLTPFRPLPLRAPKSRRINTYEVPRKCCIQRTYRIAKSFRFRTYKKQGGWGVLWLTRHATKHVCPVYPEPRRERSLGARDLSSAFSNLQPSNLQPCQRCLLNETPLPANPPSTGWPSAPFSRKDPGTGSLPQCPAPRACPCSVSRAAIHQSPRNSARPAPAFPYPAPAWDPSSPRQTKYKYFRSAESRRSLRPLRAGESLRSSRFLCESPAHCRSLPDRWQSRASRAA